MKNKKLWKAFGIMLGITFLLTWVIPSATIGSTGVSIGSITPTGFADIFTSLEVISQYFIKPAIFILFVGMFYGVANRTGAFKGAVDKIVSLTKKRKYIFLILTVLFYALTTALTGMYIELFMFVPLSVIVLTKLKYTKVQSVFATVGASTIGLIGQISNAIINEMAQFEGNKFIWVKVGLLVVLVLLTIFYVLKVKSKEEKNEIEESIMFVPEKRNAEIDINVKGIAFMIITSLLYIIFVLGLTKWSNNEIFQKAYAGLQNVKIGEFAVFDAILGSFEVFGAWTYNSLYPTIAVAILLLTIVESLKLREMVDACVEGIKKFAGIALLASLMNLVLIFTLNSGFMGTVIYYLTKGGNVALISLSTLISSPFLVDLSYSAQYNLSMVYYATSSEAIAEIWGLIVQVAYGFAMLVAPSSILLMVGLGYVEEGYKNYLKYVWKFLAAVLILCVIAILVATII